MLHKQETRELALPGFLLLFFSAHSIPYVEPAVCGKPRHMWGTLLYKVLGLILKLQSEQRKGHKKVRPAAPNNGLLYAQAIHGPHTALFSRVTSYSPILQA